MFAWLSLSSEKRVSLSLFRRDRLILSLSLLLSSILTQQTEAELKEMIQRADADQDGEVSFEDFYSIMTRRTFT